MQLEPVPEPEAEAKAEVQLACDEAPLSEPAKAMRTIVLMVAANELLPSTRKLKCEVSDLDMLLAHASRSLGLPDDIFMSHAAAEGSTASTVEAITRLDDVPAKAKVMLWRRVGGAERGREPGPMQQLRAQLPVAASL